MNPSTPDKEPEYDEQCIVCLRTVRRDDGMVHFPFEGRMITLCCPLCYAAFQEEPKSYLGRTFTRPPKDSDS